MLEDFAGRYLHCCTRRLGLFLYLSGSIGGLCETLFALLCKEIGVVSVFEWKHLKTSRDVVRAAALENPSCFCARSVASQCFTRRCSYCCASESGLFRSLV